MRPLGVMQESLKQLEVLSWAKSEFNLGQAATKYLILDDEYNPLKLLGLKASPAVTNTILSLLVSAFTAIFSLASSRKVDFQ